MAIVSYKCPNCGGGLKFDPESQKFKCEYCLSEFTEKEMEEFDGQAGNSPSAGVPAGNGGSESDVKRESGVGAVPPPAVVYTCPSCGAEIVTDETTAATFCYYCHNPVVLSGKLSGEFLPDYVLPFEVDKKKATDMFLSWIGKKKFVPSSFSTPDQLEKLSGVYFPYLLYSCKVDGKLTAEAEKTRTWITGNMQYTEHKKYQVAREGCLDVKNVTRNALSKANHELVEGVLPFGMNKMIPFQMGYLSGFQAEKRDMESGSFSREVENEVRDYTVKNLTSSVQGYSSVRVLDGSTNIRDPKWSYALLPVWVLTYRDKQKDQIYYFAMNGQTGKICGKLPVDKKKLGLLFAGIFFPVLFFLLIGGWFL